MKKIWTIRIVGLVILLNLIRILHFFFLSSSSVNQPPLPPQQQEEEQQQQEEQLSGQQSPPGYGKPWPVFSSFRPWIVNVQLPPFSCEGYFGHGFTQVFDILKVFPQEVAYSRKLKQFHVANNLVKRITAQRSDQEHWRKMEGAVDVTVDRSNLSKSRYTRNETYNDALHLDVNGQLKHLTQRRTDSQYSTDLVPRPLGSFQCLYSDTLKTSICRGAKVVMHPERIRMSKGGEPVDSVLGRTDEEELPIFTTGAFEIQVPVDGSVKAGSQVIAQQQLDFLVPPNQIGYHTMRILFDKMRTISSNQVICSKVIVEPTLIVTRFEYANLFHTLTDWYSSYVAARVLGLPQRPNVIFLDGHCQSPMDDGWLSLFSNVTYAKNFTGSVCFNDAIFTPLGYETALFKKLSSGIPCYGCSATELERDFDHSKTARLREFGDLFKATFEITDKALDKQNIKVLFIRREDYLAHPRHKGKPETRLNNEQELFDSLQSWARVQSQQSKLITVSIINGTLAHMRMKEQVQAVDAASIIIGAHGAGLAHIVFARPGTSIVELLAPQFRRPHYSHISQWMGLKYHSIDMLGTTANCAQVLELLTLILRSSLQIQKA